MSGKKKNKFKALLMERDTTQRKIAQALGVSDPVVSNWVNGIKKVPPHQIGPLAKELKTSKSVIRRLTA